jgi:hypothetical protein
MPNKLSPSLAGASLTPVGQRSVFPRQWTAFADNETIDVNRRRQSDGPEGRAEAPNRRRDEGGAPSPRSSGGGGSSSGGGGSSAGGTKLPWWAVLLLIVLFIGYSLLSGDQTPSDSGQDQPDAPVTGETARPAVSATPAPSLTPRPVTAGATGKTWTVMLYEDADDGVLEEDMMMDVNEAEKVGSSDRIKIVAQVDRFKGGYKGDSNWTSARRYFITRDDDLLRVSSKMVSDLGEVNMSDPKVLVDFVVWAMKTYPADRYALILSDHGMGWPGGWSDGASENVTKNFKIPLVESAGNNMYLMEIDQALTDIRKQAGLDKFEFLGMDACLMSDVEVYAALAPHARYAVASQETEPSLGWAYTSFLKSLSDNPDATGADLGRMVVQSYINDDQRIVDDKARAEFQRGSSAKQLATEMGRDVTLTAVDLGAWSGLSDSLNKLAYAMQSDSQPVVAKARTHARSFTSVFGEDVPPSYLDLGNFATIMQQESGKAEVRDAAGKVLTAIQKFVLLEKHGPDKRGATGVSIYFPNSALYKTNEGGPESYTGIANAFAKQSLWDDFLAFHYTKRSFQPSAAEAVSPAKNTRVNIPGEGSFEISQLTLSGTEAAPDKPITIKATLRGKNIGYVYLFVGYIDKKSNSVMVVDTDYLESPKPVREVGGVFYPQWSDNESFNLQYKWNPTVFAISDGKSTVVSLLNPDQYGSTADEAVYTVDGYYKFANGDATQYAKLYFRNKQLFQVFGFSGDNQSGAPHEITPQKGDQFTVLEKWLDTDSSGNVTESMVKGDTLTFGDTNFTWKELFAAAGDYVVGFLVTDLDGKSVQAYKTITVK